MTHSLQRAENHGARRAQKSLSGEVVPDAAVAQLEIDVVPVSGFRSQVVLALSEDLKRI